MLLEVVTPTLSTVFESITTVITNIVSEMTTVGNALLGNVIFQIMLGILIFFIVTGVIFRLVAHARQGR